MKVIAYEGVVENGCVRVPNDVSLPENAKVYVIVPGVYEIESQRVVHVRSPRLAHPEQAKDFTMEVTDILDGPEKDAEE
jgi:hypothetical protein